MKIEKIIIENIKSFKEKTEINLDKNICIFIGPNRGGKSNLLDIIIFSLRNFFVPFYRAIPQRVGGQIIEDIQRENVFHPINIFLEKYIGNEQTDSLIEITFEIGNKDIANIKFLKEHKETFNDTLKTYRNKPLQNLDFFDSWNLESLAEASHFP